MELRRGRARGWAVAGLAAVVVTMLVLGGVLLAGNRSDVQVVLGRSEQPSAPTVVDTSTTSTAAAPPTSTTTPTTTSLPAAVHPEPAMVAYIWAGDVWLYRPSGHVDQLTFDGYDRYDSSPRFLGMERLTFVSSDPSRVDSVLVEIDLPRGRRRDVVAVAGSIAAYAWSPDGATLTYLGWRSDGGSELRRFSPTTGKTVVLRTLGQRAGRGGYSYYDQSKAEWSPDGSKLLVVNTALDTVAPSNTIFVLRPDGSDVVPPRKGTWGTWAADSRRISFEREGPVLTLDLASGREDHLPVTGPARRLAASPDGRFIAFDDDAPTPTVFLYDVAARTTRRLQAEALAPVWGSTDKLLAGRATRCVSTPRHDCEGGGHGTPWTETGAAWAITPDPAAATSIPLGSTLDAAVGPG
jgi:hypothetical protein